MVMMRNNETEQPQNNEEDRDVEMGLTTHSYESNDDGPQTNNNDAIPEEEQEQPHRENLAQQDNANDELKNVADGYTQYHPATRQDADQ
jgi:hypothetical protein